MSDNVKPDALKNLFRHRLKELRELRGLSQSDVARALEVPPSYICALEAGSKSPNLSTIARLATALEIDPDELLSREKISA
jgi:transcriptional regulator with XRE-family HTH domain